MKHFSLLALFMAVSLSMAAQTHYDFSKLQQERLDRGVVALRTSDKEVMVSWRYLPSDPVDVTFEIFRNGKKVGTRGSKESTQFFDTYSGTGKTTYEVRALNAKGKQISTAGSKFSVSSSQSSVISSSSPAPFLSIPLSAPSDFYTANDAAVADLDGDGQMEIVLKWDPRNSRDNSQSGLTDPTYFDALKLDGTRLWRICLGRNIRSGAHYTPFLVADFDGNGCAELIVRTSDGTVDGTGAILGDSAADYRVQPNLANYGARDYPNEEFRMRDSKNRRGGFIDRGSEWVTCFDGRTGKALSTVDYIPERGELSAWGDNYANRSDRFLAAVGYLDGEHLSAIMCRGYYTRSVLAAYDFDGKTLKTHWVFDTNTPEWRSYAGQGNHNLRVGDVDGDGCDEITYGSMCVDHDGKGLYNTRFGHGDAMHLTAFLPLNDALQVWDCHENKRDGTDFRDAKTGKVLFQLKNDKDVGRCMAADIDPDNSGLEMWSAASGGIRNYKGECIDAHARISMNFGIWWDGDLSRELLDHETVSKYRGTKDILRHAQEPRHGTKNEGLKDTEEGLGREHYDFSGSDQMETLVHFDGCQFNNGSKSNPTICGDIIGDWREEVLTRTADNKFLRLYVTAIPTPYRFHTFLADPVYRHSLTLQNVAYNQPTQVGFYFGSELEGSGRMFRGWYFAPEQQQRVVSPDGLTYLDVQFGGGKATYSAGYRKVVKKDTIDVPMITNAPLGLKSNVADWIENLVWKGFELSSRTDDYTLRQSKASKVHYEANVAVVSLGTKDKGRGSKALAIRFEVSNNNIAFRYEIPQQGATAAIVVTEEASGFRFPTSTTAFICPQSDPMVGWQRTKPSYEEQYINDAPITTPSGYGHGWTFPCLFHEGDNGWVLLSETGVNSNYCGSHLSDYQGDGLFSIAFPMEGENNGFGSTGAQFGLPGVTPWRTITLAPTLQPIVETTIAWDVVEQLYEPSIAYQGGRSTWSWILWQDPSINERDQRTYLKLSADLGWEYCLIDGGWMTNIGREGMERLFAYADSLGVHPWVWYNSNGGWNDAPQCAKQRMHNPIVRKEEFRWLSQHGVKGVKVDFFAGDKQETMRLYEAILSDANDFGIQCIFHGCTLPRGWERMYPNYCSSEAVLASENLVFNQHFDDNEAFNACLHPFVRNTTASMEFGGTILQNRLNRNNDGGTERRTSDIFELATAIAFQSSVQNFALTPRNLTEQPTFEIDFMRQVPTTWDETRLLDGYPGKYIALARRHGEQWCVCLMNAEQEPHTFSLRIPMLAGKRVTYLYDEATTPTATTYQFDNLGTFQCTVPSQSAAVLY